MNSIYNPISIEVFEQLIEEQATWQDNPFFCHVCGQSLKHPVVLSTGEVYGTVQ